MPPSPRKGPVLVVGSLNLDLVVRAGRIPQPGETVMGERFARHFGGKGANQAVAAAMAGGEVTLLGGLGEDAFGHDYREHLAQTGVQLDLLQHFADETTGVALITVAADGENAIAIAPGANGRLTPAHLESVEWERFAVVLFQLESPMEVVAEGLRRARAAGCITVLTPAPARSLPSEWLEWIDLLVPNEHEITLVGPELPWEDAAREMLSQGVGAVLVSRGGEGAALFTAEGRVDFPAFPAEVVDTVGAGDCLTGALSAAWSLGATLPEAIRFGSAAAALAVGREGA